MKDRSVALLVINIVLTLWVLVYLHAALGDMFYYIAHTDDNVQYMRYKQLPKGVDDGK